jgi:hypothetical protein
MDTSVSQSEPNVAVAQRLTGNHPRWLQRTVTGTRSKAFAPLRRSNERDEAVFPWRAERVPMPGGPAARRSRGHARARLWGRRAERRRAPCAVRQTQPAPVRRELGHLKSQRNTPISSPWKRPVRASRRCSAPENPQHPREKLSTAHARRNGRKSRLDDKPRAPRDAKRVKNNARSIAFFWGARARRVPLQGEPGASSRLRHHQAGAVARLRRLSPPTSRSITVARGNGVHSLVSTNPQRNRNRAALGQRPPAITKARVGLVEGLASPLEQFYHSEREAPTGLVGRASVAAVFGISARNLATPCHAR